MQTDGGREVTAISSSRRVSAEPGGPHACFLACRSSSLLLDENANNVSPKPTVRVYSTHLSTCRRHAHADTCRCTVESAKHAPLRCRSLLFFFKPPSLLSALAVLLILLLRVLSRYASFFQTRCSSAGKAVCITSLANDFASVRIES